MFCKNCGKELNDDAVVCPNCGVPTDNFNKGITETPQKTGNKVNVCAILGLIFSIVAFVFLWILDALFFIFVVAALALSIVGMVMSSKMQSGKGLAIAGLVVSIVDIVFYLVCLFIVFSWIY